MIVLYTYPGLVRPLRFGSAWSFHQVSRLNADAVYEEWRHNRGRFFRCQDVCNNIHRESRQCQRVFESGKSCGDIRVWTPYMASLQYADRERLWLLPHSEIVVFKDKLTIALFCSYYPSNGRRNWISIKSVGYYGLEECSTTENQIFHFCLLSRCNRPMFNLLAFLYAVLACCICLGCNKDMLLHICTLHSRC